MPAPPSSCDVPPALMEELIEEILLRFPPDDPASLLSAALVCKGWCRLVSDPGFHRRFRELHRTTPPVLGFLCRYNKYAPPFCHFPLLGAARFIPAATTSFRRLPRAAVVAPTWLALDALHDGRVLFYDRSRSKTGDLDLLVCNPMITGEVRRLPTLVLPGVRVPGWSAAFLCPGGCGGDDHAGGGGGCPLRVVVVSTEQSTGITSAYVYYSSSEEEQRLHAWSMQTSIQHSDLGSSVYPQHHSARIRKNNALYFRCNASRFCLEYHMSKQQLSAIRLPSEAQQCRVSAVMTAEDGGLGLAIVRDYNLYTWSSSSSSSGTDDNMDGQVITWGNKRVIPLSELLLPAVTKSTYAAAAVDVPGVIWIWTEAGLFTVDIKSSQVAKLWERDDAGGHIGDIVPYVAFCTPAGTSSHRL